MDLGHDADVVVAALDGSAAERAAVVAESWLAVLFQLQLDLLEQESGIDLLLVQDLDHASPWNASSNPDQTCSLSQLVADLE